MDFDIGWALWVAVVFVLAGTVKGITGMGLPTVAVSLLGLMMAPAQAAALLVLPSLATNVAQCRGPHLRGLCRRLWPLWLGLVAALLLVPALPSHTLLNPRRLLGATLVLYGTWGLLRPALPDLSSSPAWLGLIAGLITGTVAALTAVFVIPLVPYLQAQRMDKNMTVQALGLSFMVATLALALRLQGNADHALWSSASLLALAGAFAGLGLGAFCRARLSGTAFQRALFLVFVGLGAANLLQPG